MANAQELLRRKQFARKLQHALIARGWTQSELARRMNEQLPKDAQGEARRDLISRYLKGVHLPGVIYLHAMAAALKMEPDDLLPPEDSVTVDPNTPLSMTDAGSGRVLLRINQVVEYSTALRVLEMLQKEAA